METVVLLLIFPNAASRRYNWSIYVGLHSHTIGCFCKMRFNIILSSISRSRDWSLLFRVFHSNPERISKLSLRVRARYNSSALIYGSLNIRSIEPRISSRNFLNSAVRQQIIGNANCSVKPYAFCIKLYLFLELDFPSLWAEIA
jgi:hypothetical protein